MSCRHGGGPKDKEQKECRACLQDVVRQLRWDIQNLKDELATVHDKDMILKTKDQYHILRSQLNSCVSVFGYVIRHTESLDLVAYLEKIYAATKNVLRNTE